LFKLEKFVCDELDFFEFELFNPRVELTSLLNPWVGFELLSETQPYDQAIQRATYYIDKQRHEKFTNSEHSNVFDQQINEDSQYESVEE
jgi:hypothetical protein